MVDSQLEGAALDGTPPGASVSDVDLIEYICDDPKVFYKNQQINDEELSATEKRSILLEVLQKNHSTFLSRFGLFIKEDHLQFFEHPQQTMVYSPDEQYEVDYHLKRIRRSHAGGRMIEVRNRRYAALNEMLRQGSYFTEVEMMQREPLLYEQLVGQYLTEQEKYKRDASGPRIDSIVSIVFKEMDKENAEKLRAEQEDQEKIWEEEDEELMEETSARPESPGASTAQWGNFDEEEADRVKAREREKERKSRNRRQTLPAHCLTAGERNLLRDEFTGIMYSKFIAGEDENFDYSKIDDSREYDDLDIVEQDEQEKYFDCDDDDEQPAVQAPQPAKDDAEESEDDLDVYMRHLNQHLHNQRRMGNANEEEFDSDE